jgi:hypothetical protein
MQATDWHDRDQTGMRVAVLYDRLNLLVLAYTALADELDLEAMLGSKALGALAQQVAQPLRRQAPESRF